jgi:hypothetical protein
MTKEIDISRVLIEGDIATIMGEKYQRIIEPQSFNNKLHRLLKPNLDERVDTGEITVRVLDLIRENIPEPVVYDGEEYDMGWNDAIQKVKDNLFK